METPTNPDSDPDAEGRSAFANYLDEGFLYPWFPYFTDDQQLLEGPPYQQFGERLAKICHDNGLIASYQCKPEGVHSYVWYITFSDGTSMRLSPMQAMLVLMGVLKGHKGMKEHELGLKPLFEEKVHILKLPRPDAPITPYLERETPIAGRRVTTELVRDPRGKAAKIKAAAEKEELPADLQAMVDEATSGLTDALDDDDIFDGLFD